MSQTDVVGIGNAIVDVLFHADDAFLERNSLVKGAMTLIDDDRAGELQQALEPEVRCSGGSAANTIAGLASLGGSGAYVGKTHDDALGRVFRDDIRAIGVRFDTPAADTGPATACCLIFVTPDAQRTMQTFLGASATLSPSDLDPETIRNARITYLEGYLWDPAPAKQAFVEAARVAHEAGRKVALTLSDRFCVERHRPEFRDLVEHQADIVFANEEEILALYETPDLSQALAALRGHCGIAAVTRGAAGSVIVRGDETFEVPAEPVERVVDTTGAGDLFAAGFLYGLARGHDPARCGRIGGIAAAEVISHFGARPAVALHGLVEARLGS